MQLAIEPTGQVRCVYDEAINLHSFGPLTIRRGSHVEPTEDGQWLASLEDGPILGPFLLRSDALAAERQWLAEHWLSSAR